MINRKNELTGFVSSTISQFEIAVNAVPDLLEESFKKIKMQAESSLEEINNGELLIPVVGGFSAGKSTAINNFLGRDILPVEITAETSIPAEIRYGHEERILAYNDNGDEELYQLSDLPALTERGEAYTLLKIFVDSNALKDAEPFVLVDMPGFDSSLKQHNDAILRYLACGAYYLYFINCSDGTVKSSDLRRLAEIDSSGKDFHIVLSKSDLLPVSQVQEVKEHVNQLIDDNLGIDNTVHTIGFDNIEAIYDVIKSSDPEKVFNNNFVGEAKGLFYDISACLNSAISTLKKTSQEKENELTTLSSSLDELLSQRDSKVAELKNKSTNSYESQILSSIEKDLKGSLQELVSAAKQSEDALSRVITDIVRAGLVREMRVVTGNLSSNIVNDFALHIDAQLLSNGLNKQDWLNGLMSTLQSEVMESLSGVLNKGQKGSGTAIGGLLSSIATLIPHPLLKVVLAILPGILGAFVDMYSQNKKDENLKATLSSDVIPNIKNQLRPEISKSLNEVIASMVSAVSNQFKERITEQTLIVEKSQSFTDEQLSAYTAQSEILQSTLNSVNTLAEKTLM